jgi:tRNA G18 (ribose-2'-O)-methylase SpoU
MREVVALLHNIRSVHNVGSMFRTADGAGIRKLYLAGFTPTPLDRFGEYRKDMIKTALGAERMVPWMHERSVGPMLRRLRKEGYAIVALEKRKGALSPAQARKKLGKRKICLVVGNEVAGLSPALCRAADIVVELPMHGEKESLNVSVAFGIAAYALMGL